MVASLVSLVAGALWAMVPAYVPNNAAAVAGGGRPVDGGRAIGDARLLGDGKTWRGTAVGVAAGVGAAVALNVVGPAANRLLVASTATLPTFTPTAAVGLAVGAMAGDVAASFLKRRSGRERGAALPLLDQLDFVAGALGMTALLAPEWFGATFTSTRLLVVVVATPLLHVGTNVVAYGVGVKDEPW